jgi:hypothetical protein
LLRALLAIVVELFRAHQQRDAERKEASRERVREVVDAVYSGDRSRLGLLLAGRLPNRPDA